MNGSNSLNRRFTLLAIAVAGSLAPGLSQAEDSSTTLEEVVITAEKRPENTQTAALAVSVLDGGELEKRAVRDFRDLQAVTPSLSVTESGILTFMNIRGIGLTLSSPTVVSGVATYRDGLFSPSPIFMSEPMFDAASIEVLRGPQGTFVGQNSTGGAVFQTSRSPELGGESSGHFGLSIGQYQRFGVDAVANMPLSETLALRIAVATEKRDSYFSNRNSKATPGSVDHKSVRIGLLWKPSDNFELLWKTEANIARDGGYPYQPQPGSPNAVAASADPWTLTMDRADIDDRHDSVRTGIEAKLTLDNGVVIRSLSGYQLGTQNFANDTDGTSLDLGWEHQRILDRVFSQELDVISPSTDRVRWTVGGSWVRQEAHLDLHAYSNAFPFGPGGFFPTQDVHFLTDTPKTAVGAFAQVSTDLREGLELQAGARWSRDRQTQSGGLFLAPAPPLPPFIPAFGPSYEQAHVTGKVALNWKLDAAHFLYVFAANGFKSGGVNLTALPFAAEKVKDIEAGWKATWADGHVRTQFGVFYMDYRNLQTELVDTTIGASATGNAPKSTIKGAEFQLQAKYGGFATDFNWSYVDSRTDGMPMINIRNLPGGSAAGLGPQCAPGQPPFGCFDYAPFFSTPTGNATPYAPKTTANVGLEYAFEAAGSTWTPRIDISHLSEQFSSLFASQFDRIPARTIVNASIGIERGPWRGLVQVMNLGDKTYVSGIDYVTGNMWLGTPRTVGVSLRRSF